MSRYSLKMHVEAIFIVHLRQNLLLLINHFNIMAIIYDCCILCASMGANFADHIFQPGSLCYNLVKTELMTFPLQ